MTTPLRDFSAALAPRAELELTTGDALCALRHVVGCLARRSHELLGLSCLPGPAGQGRLVVAVADDGRLERLLAELRALPEVCGARLSQAAGAALASAAPATA
jgi:acetolactate synthase-1/3 small subunit